ncbi:MAG: hypothetical protein H7122_16795 [Chitinophagaceae bacterium]|nr:hypothetical protein [Chitinophagaceae bacterium]
MEIGNAINWFEIPVADFDRARKFYETIFNYQMPENQMGQARKEFLLFEGRILQAKKKFHPHNNWDFGHWCWIQKEIA